MAVIKSVRRMLKKLGVLGFSSKRNIFGMNPLIVSSLFIVLTAVLATGARKLTKAVIKTDNVPRQLLLEFIATAELCASCFELIIGKKLLIIMESGSTLCFYSYLQFGGLKYGKTPVPVHTPYSKR